MKNTILFILLFAGIFQVSCSDDNLENDNQQKVAFRFTADTASMYSFAIRLDTTVVSDSAHATTYSKEYIAYNLFEPPADTVKFTAFPPLDWVGTNRNASVTLEILYNGQVVADTTGVLSGFDRPTGITVQTVF